MKVVAISGSPLMNKGNTAMVLTPFLEGLREGGADIELFHTSTMKINPCNGDIACWVKTPGRCIHDDDMQTLLPRLQAADIWVFASPLYMDGVTGSLKSVIERMNPMAHPFMEIHEGCNRHLMREPVKEGRVVLVSNSGFWELENFEPLLVFMKALCKNFRRNFAGALLRPHGPAMRFMKTEALQSVFVSAKQAGLTLAESGEIPPWLLDDVSLDLLPRDAYIAAINQGFKKILDARGLQ